MKNQNFKSGFVSIIGRPNVGKSTLLNALVGEKIAIISDKPQTTRNKILAIRNTDDAQIIFTDTPGIHKPKNKLGEYMVKVANESVGEMDAVLFVVDATNKTTEPERKIAQNLRALRVPVILVINKVDLARKESLLPMIADFSSLHDFEAIVPVSALKNDGVDRLLNEIMQNIPQGTGFLPGRYDHRPTGKANRGGDHPRKAFVAARQGGAARHRHRNPANEGAGQAHLHSGQHLL